MEEITNSDIFLWALSELGGAQDVVDVETVFWRCFELAPQRFSWRTRADLPDYKKCAKALRDAEARRPALLVKTGDSFGRQLTVAGQKWIDSNKSRLATHFKPGKVVREPKKRPSSRLLAEAEQSPPFLAWRAQGVVPEHKWQMAEILRCSPDSEIRVWRHRIETLRSAANSAQQKQLLEFLDAVVKAHPSWFGGGTDES